MRDILETELPPLPADDRPDSRTNERSSAFDYSRGSASHAEFLTGPFSTTFTFAIAAGERFDAGGDRGLTPACSIRLRSRSGLRRR